MDVLKLLVFLAGLSLVAWTLITAIRGFVLPRGTDDLLPRLVFVALRYVFALSMRKVRSFKRRDQIMAMYAPFGLFALLPAWLTLVLVGYMCMYWAVGTGTWFDAFKLSGSSLLTLGFATTEQVFMSILVFSEAILGLILVALLIGYLPAIYSAFARREIAVTGLEVRAGKPPSAVELLKRYNRLHGLDRLGEVWAAWETWFADIEESHVSLPVLAFFRSPHPDRSWVTAAGAVLDAAALTASTIDVPFDIRSAICIRAGYLALRGIAEFFRIPFDPNPKPNDPISITRAEFDAACDELAQSRVPLKSDRDQAWRDFAGWRVNYDTALLALAQLVMAPYAPWASDRLVKHGGPKYTRLMSDVPLP